jgi:hypothetical protein
MTMVKKKMAAAGAFCLRKRNALYIAREQIKLGDLRGVIPQNNLLACGNLSSCG